MNSLSFPKGQKRNGRSGLRSEPETVAATIHRTLAHPARHHPAICYLIEVGQSPPRLLISLPDLKCQSTIDLMGHSYAECRSPRALLVQMNPHSLHSAGGGTTARHRGLRSTPNEHQAAGRRFGSKHTACPSRPSFHSCECDK